jgi:hypothetical protein
MPILVNIKQEVLGRTNHLLSFDRTRIAYETQPPTVLRCVFTELLDTSMGIYRQTRRQRPTGLLLFLVFVTAGICLPSCRGATMGGIHMQKHILMEGIYEVRY